MGMNIIVYPSGSNIITYPPGATWCSTVRAIYTSSPLTHLCAPLLLRAVSVLYFCNLIYLHMCISFLFSSSLTHIHVFAFESGEFFEDKMSTEKEEYHAASAKSFPQVSAIWVDANIFSTKLVSFNIWVSHLRISLQGCWKCQLGVGRISSFIVSKCKTFPYFRQYSPDLMSTISFYYFALMWNVFRSFC